MSFDDWDSEVQGYKAASGGKPPDGRYQAEIEDCRYNVAEQKILWRLKLLGRGGEAVVFHKRTLDSKEWRERAWNDLQNCGLNAESWSEAIDALPTLTGTVIDVKLVTNAKGSHQNVYVNGVVNALTSEETPF